jgi:uncharacterized protein (UPF0248 family)
VLKTVKLLLPALIPSWRFFDTMAPSPRIEFTLLKAAHDVPENWQEFRPRPAHLSVGSMLKRLFWNPRWNETLFLISCAERLMENGAEHSAREIAKRVQTELEQKAMLGREMPYLRFRLVCVYRQGMRLQQHIAFTSPVYPNSGNLVS